ncbi:MAG: cytochrome c oxidase subunit 3 [Pyrinomonadaceae bacterium]|nr:cytochrome c oxidase subunit 3 [Pyrinomonadaceae bacterium]
MSTIVTGTKKSAGHGTKGGLAGSNGHRKNGSRGGGGGGGGRDDKHDGRDQNFSPIRYRIAILMAIAAIMTMFAALTLVFVLRSNSGGWRPLHLPTVLWLSTALIITSSLTVENARRFLKRGAEKLYRQWLLVTLLLGAGFIAGQLVAWQQLRAQGVFLASNPHSGFFYLLTGAHALHLLGGIAALCYLIFRRVRHDAKDDQHFVARRQAAADVGILYWHFMDALWIYLFALLLLSK